MSDNKKISIDGIPECIEIAVKNVVDEPSKSIGTSLADIFYLVFGGPIGYLKDKLELKFKYALEQYEESLKEKYCKISEENLLEPDIQIVATALENSKYCIDKEELRKMFENLITSSLNKELYSYVHPIFSDIIKKMTPDDARLLKVVYHLSPRDSIYSTNFGDIFASISALENLGLIYVDSKVTHDTVDSTENFLILSEKTIRLDFDSKRNKISNIAMSIEAKEGYELTDELVTTQNVFNMLCYEYIDQVLNDIYCTKLGYDFVKACVENDTYC